MMEREELACAAEPIGGSIMEPPLLAVQGLKVYYPVKAKNRLSSRVSYLKAVDGVSLEVATNETVGIVGESGCGKSTMGKAIVGLLKPTEGTIAFEGRPYEDISTKERAKNIQIIFQDPYSSLDPRMPVGESIEGPLAVIEGMPREERRRRGLELMEEVGLRADQYNRYPHEFSGGQRQRIGIARALATNPKIVVCGVAVSALDVSIQAQILNLINDLKERYQLSFLFISHNLSVVQHICDKVAVMYLGHIVEYGDVDSIFENPQHPYTQALLDAIPLIKIGLDSSIRGIEGDVPSALDPPSGCCFHTRCPHATEECGRARPASIRVGEQHWCSCRLAVPFDGGAEAGISHEAVPA